MLPTSKEIHHDAAKPGSFTAARKIDIGTTVAVVNLAVHLTTFERSERAAFLTADVAIDKAWTAASFGVPTQTRTRIIGDSEVVQLAHPPPCFGGWGLPDCRR